MLFRRISTKAVLCILIITLTTTAFPPFVSRSEAVFGGAELAALLTTVKNILETVGNVKRLITDQLNMIRDAMSIVTNFTGQIRSVISQIENIRSEIESLANLPEEIKNEINNVSSEIERMCSLNSLLSGGSGGGGWLPSSEGEEVTEEVAAIEEAKGKGTSTFTKAVVDAANTQAKIWWGYGATMRMTYALRVADEKTGKWKFRTDEPKGSVIGYLKKCHRYVQEVSDKLESMPVPSGENSAEAKLALEQMRIMAELSLFQSSVLLALIEAQSEANDMLAAIYMQGSSQEYSRILKNYLSGVRQDTSSGLLSIY